MSQRRLIRVFDRLCAETTSFLPRFPKRVPPFRPGLLIGHSADYPHPRNCAMCAWLDTPQGRQIDIFVAPKVLKMDLGRQEGLLRHEFGHAVEFYLQDRLPEVLPGLPKGIERRADQIAERIYGDPIYYDADLIQTISGGTRPRPRHLGL